MNKKILLILICLLTLPTAFLLYKNIYKKSPTSESKQLPAVNQKTDSSNGPPQIVSTKPDPLENTIVSATQVIEITFNRPLQNSGEFKLKMEPKIEVKVELSSDRKTAKIIPLKPFALGEDYSISIGPDTKFDGIQHWGQDKTYHFKTVKYTGV